MECRIEYSAGNRWICGCLFDGENEVVDLIISNNVNSNRI